MFSVYQRLRAARKDVDVKPVNLARPGVGVAPLSEQATDAVARHADYITILIGANDACQWPMIDAATFRSYLNDALAMIRQGRPTAQIQIVSIPNLVHLWKSHTAIPGRSWSGDSRNARH